MSIEQIENQPPAVASDPRPVAIKVAGLVKTFGKQVAVNHFNFEVAQGAIFGFVGPNGAGKTTTIKILATLLDPTSGSASVGGYDVTRQPAKVRDVMGYMPDFFGVYDDLTVMEYLDFYSRTQGVAGKNRARLLNDLLDLVELGHKRDAYVDTLSRGMQQRLCLARCLVHDPQVLLLDEPASGLDPRARVEMRELLKELGKMGKTILISSHILPELAELCTDIGIVKRGQFITSGPVDEVAQALGRKHLLRVRLLPDDIASPAVQLEQAARILTHQPGLEPATLPTVDAPRAEIQAQFTGSDRQLQAALAALMQAGLPVLHFALERSNLEDIFLDITEE